MCGLAGLLLSPMTGSSPSERRATVQTMTGLLSHRGPDAEGLWVDPQGRCILGHRRLSIIDTSDAGIQPMASADGRYVVSFNGEVYNYLELRPLLEAAGYVFRGRTDTEVLLAAFATWGTSAFARLDGMFAAAIFDTATGDLVLVRDPFGEKPLYLAQLDGGDIAFASELHALEHAPGFDSEIDLVAASQVLTMQYADAPRTIYRSASKVSPGSWMRLRRDGSRQSERYFRFAPGRTGYSHRSLPDLADELEDILLRSIRRRLIADVPLGAFLSGGVDSSTVCALIRRRLGVPLDTFSIGFEGAPESEHRIARALAEHLGCRHHEQVLTPDARRFFDEAGAILDEPNGDSSCLPTFMLSRFARERVTVALSGDGGDEMFGGYGRYFALLGGSSAPPQGGTAGASYYGDLVFVARESLVEEVFGHLPPEFARYVAGLRREIDESGDGLLGAMRRTDVEHYLPGAVLPKVDRMSMRFALEVRTPYLSIDLARFAERLPDSHLADNSRGKKILREVAYRYLPAEIMDLPKQGFGLPLQDWSRAMLLDVGQHLLLGDDCRLAEAFGRTGLESLMRQQTASFSVYSLWGVLVLESWLRKHPGRLPDLREHRTRSIAATDPPADPPADPGRPGLSEPTSMRVVRVSPTLYLAGDLAEEVHAEAAAGAAGGDLIFDCGDWSEVPTPEQWPPQRYEALLALRGAAVRIEGPMALRRFDRNDLERLDRLGIRRVVLAHECQGGRDAEVAISAATLEQRQASLDQMRSSALFEGGIADDESEVGFSYVRHGVFSFGQVGAFKDSVGRDASDEFAVFLDNEQLMPLQLVGGTLDDRAGLFSIWNGELAFSPPRRLLRGDERIWVVRPEGVEDRLPFVWRELGPAFEATCAAIAAKPLRIPDAGAPALADRNAPVVVCTHSLAPGGAERQWVYLAEGLAAAGRNVTFVTYRPLVGDAAHYLPMLATPDIRHVDASKLQMGEILQACQGMDLVDELYASSGHAVEVARLAATFQRIKPSAVLLELDPPNIWGGLAAMLADVPRIIFSFRNRNPSRLSYMQNDWMLPAYRWLAASPRVRLTGNSEAANRDYAEWIGMDPDRVVPIANAIDPARFPAPGAAELARTRVSLGLAREAPLILGIGRLTKEKNFTSFVEVCARVIARKPATRALIAGVGTQRAAVQAAIDQHGLTGRIDLLDLRDDVNVLLALASVLLITSRVEGMPNVAMEALLMGTPVVSTNVGSIASIVRHGTTGLIAPIDDVEGLTAHVLSLLDEPKRLVTMGWRGRADVLARFSKASMAAGYDAQIYDGCAAREADCLPSLVRSHG